MAILQNNTPQKGTSSGRFTNIQNYLKANQPGANKLASNVSSNISNVGQQAKQGLQQEQSAFDTQSQQGRLVKGQADVQAQNIIQNAGQQVYGAGTEANKDVVGQFQRISSGQYQGPQSFQNLDTIRAKGQQAQQMGSLSGTEGGRFTLLRQMFSNPQYSQGQTKLDQLLLGNKSGQLRQARQQVAALPQTIDVAANQAQNRAQAYTQEAQSVGEQVRKQLQEQTNLTEQQINDRVKAAQEREQQLREQFGQTEQGLRGQQVGLSDFQRLGLQDVLGVNPEQTPEAMTYGLNLADYLKTNTSVDPTRDTAISREQAAMRNALSQLGGTTADIDFSKAGTYKESTQGIDADRFKSDMAKAKADYEAKMAEAGKLDQVNQALLQNIRHSQYSAITPTQGLMRALNNFNINTDNLQSALERMDANSVNASIQQLKQQNPNLDPRLVQQLSDIGSQMTEAQQNLQSLGYGDYNALNRASSEAMGTDTAVGNISAATRARRSALEEVLNRYRTPLRINRG